jgi:cytochrome c biogenesis protein CcdA
LIESFNHLVEAVFAPLEDNISTVAPAGLLLLGLITGLRHSMEADHIAAVSTIMATSERHKKLRRAPLLGALWGLGHTSSLFVAGLVVLLLAVSIPQKVSNTLEFGVGVMLVFLGATTLTGFNIGKFMRGIFSRHKHEHPHVHEDIGVVHSHEHDHHDHKHGHKSLTVGMVHGMAGSGALMILVLSTISSVPLGLAYIAIFGAGSIASMTAMSTLIGLPFAKTRRYGLSLALRYIAAAITLAIGAGLIYELGFVKQVFL